MFLVSEQTFKKAKNTITHETTSLDGPETVQHNRHEKVYQRATLAIQTILRTLAPFLQAWFGGRYIGRVSERGLLFGVCTIH